MDLFRIVVAVRRRWWLTVPLLALAVAGAVNVYANREILYESTLSAVLTADGTELRSGGDRTPSGLVIAAILESDRVRAAVVGDDADVSYDVRAGLDADGTLVDVEAVAASPERAVAVVQGLLDRLVLEVRDREADLNLPAEDRVVIQPLAVPLEARRLEQEAPSPDVTLPPRFLAQGATLLSVPEIPATPFPPEATTVRYLEELMNTDVVLDRLARDDTTEVTLQRNVNDRDRVPIFYITVVANTPAETARVLDEALTEAQRQLAQLQADAGVPPAAHTVIRQLTAPSPPEEADTQIRRSLVLVALLGLFVAVSVPVIVDGMVLRRRQPQASPLASATAHPADAAPPSGEDESMEDPVRLGTDLHPAAEVSTRPSPVRMATARSVRSASAEDIEETSPPTVRDEGPWRADGSGR